MFKINKTCVSFEFHYNVVKCINNNIPITNNILKNNTKIIIVVGIRARYLLHSKQGHVPPRQINARTRRHLCLEQQIRLNKSIDSGSHKYLEVAL